MALPACGGFGGLDAAVAPSADEAGDGGRVAVEDGDGKAVAQQAGGEVAAEMAEADEGVGLSGHCHSGLVFVGYGISGVCIICRCRSLPV